MKSGKKMLLLVALPVALGAVVVVLLLFVIKPFDPVPAVRDPAPGEHGMMLPLDTKVVNLAPGGDYKYAKVGVTLELRPDAVGFYAMKPAEKDPLVVLKVKDMAEMLPLLDDAVAKVVSAKSSTDLLNDTGREQLKGELLEAVRGVLDSEVASASAAPAASGASAAPAASGAGAAPSGAGSEVLGLYFTDLVMQ